jgi:hypothetical protein
MLSTIESRKDLDGRLEVAAWGLFTLLCGLVLLMPELPDGTWLTGTGAIILGFAALRADLGLPNSAFWPVMGIGFAAFGAGELAGLALPWIAGLIVVCGLAIVAEAIATRPRLA